MGKEPHKLIDVRGVLEKNAISTTVDQLKRGGRNRVKVINAKQISALIEESVARVVEAQQKLAQGGFDQSDVDALVEESRAEFRKLVAERERELETLRAEKEAIERQREALEREVSEKRRLERTVERAREDLQRVVGTPNLEDLEHVLQSYHEKQSEALHSEEEFEALRREAEEKGEVSRIERERAEEYRERITELKAALDESRGQSVRLREELEKAKESGGANGTGGQEVIAAVLSQLQELKEGLEARPAAASAGDPQAMEGFAETMAKKLEEFGRKIGVSSAVGGDEEVALDAIFDTSTAIESNIDDVKVQERTGAGIGGALARMRAMKQGGATPQKEE